VVRTARRAGQGLKGELSEANSRIGESRHAGRRKAHEERQRQASKPDSEQRSGSSDDEDFGELNAQQLAATRTDGLAHGHLALPAFGADEKEVGDVRTGDEQDDARAAEEDPEGPGRGAKDLLAE